MAPGPPPPRLQFGEFSLDPRAGELWRQGTRLRLQDKPLCLLLALLRRPGEVVTRAELQKELWPEATFLDFEDGINSVVRRLREALQDAADSPRLVETVPRRGYRWIGPALEEPLAPAAPAPEVAAASPPPPPARRRRLLWALAAVLLVAAGAGSYWLLASRAVFAFRSQDTVLIADMDNQTGEPRLDRALTGALTVSLEQSPRLAVYPRTQLPEVLQRMGQPAQTAVTAALGREICQREGIRALLVPGITRTGNAYDLTAELLDPATGTVERSYNQRAAGADQILDSLGRIADAVRRDLGESVLQVRTHTQPLPQVTTTSLAALQDYADGQQAWRGGDFQAALDLYHSALALDPHFAMAHAALASANCSYLFYAMDACRAEYAEALAPGSHLTDREREIINTQFADDTGAVPRALTLYQNYLRHYPNDLEMLADYAHLLRLHSQETQALSVYRALLRLDPNNAGTYVEIASAEMTLGNYNQSLGAYRQAFQLAPQWELAGDVNREYGFTLVRAGQMDQAAAAFGHLLRDPNLRATGMNSLARLEFWQGELSRARQQELNALAAQRDPSALTLSRSHMLLAQIAEAGGDRATATGELQAAMANFDQLDPKLPWGALVAGEWLRLGEMAPAQRILVQIAPLARPEDREQNGYLRWLRGEMAVARGDPGQALAILGLPSDDDGPSVGALTTVALANAYQQQGNLKQAVVWYGKVVGPAQGDLGWEPQPRAQAAYYWLAYDQAALGNHAGAVAALTPLLHLLQSADAACLLRQQTVALAAQLHFSLR